MGGKVLIPTAAHERNLIAARLAADVCGTPTFVLARTDAESAKLITADVDERDREFITGERTAEGFFRLKPGTGLAHCIKRGIAFAKYADLLWWETSTPNLDEAKEFAEAVHKVYPGKMLAYNCSPSFNWEANIDKATIAKFQREIGAMGYKFQFVTLAGFHSLNHGMFELARGYKAEGMAAYSRLQQAEFASEKHGYSATRHQREVGTGYFDLVSTTITGGTSSTTALHDSTEAAQFKAHGSEIKVQAAGITGDYHDQRQQFLGDWRRVRFDELPQARGRLGPGAGSVQDPQGSRGCLARGLGREPSQGRRALFHRGRARTRHGLRPLPPRKRENVQGRRAASSGDPGGAACSFSQAGESCKAYWEQTAFAENTVADRLKASAPPIRTKAASGCQTRKIPGAMPPPIRVRSGCAMRCGRRGSRLPIAPASSSTCAMPKWPGSKFSTRRSTRCSRKFPISVDLFDRGISQGETPRLWIDVVAHVVMGRDKRIYRFVQDTRFGRIVIAESHEVAAIVEAVTDYVARRMIEREHALVATPGAGRRSRSRAAAGSGPSRSASSSAWSRCSASRCSRPCA